MDPVIQAKNILIGTEKKTMTARRDRTLRVFLRPEIGRFSVHFGAIPLSYTEDLEKKEKIHWRKLPKIQWRRRPEIADLCPLSWSNAS